MSSSRVQELIDELISQGNPEIATHSQRFFKTGPGGYGEGDTFIGVRVPVIRTVAKAYKDLSPDEIYELAQSPVHEIRLCAVFVLVGQFKRSRNLTQQGELFDLLLELVITGRVNNWDLVDSSAPYLGAYLPHLPDYEKFLDSWSSSPDLWQRRTAVMLTFALIRDGIFEPTLVLCTKLLGDTEDLIHKATGWMLREVGRRDLSVLRAFLDAHAATMPRTMLRYAIEHLEPAERLHYLQQKSLLA